MSIHYKLQSFLEKGIISDIISSFGFNYECYYSTNSKIPSKEQFNNLKERLLLMIYVPFKKQIKKKLQQYISDPHLYRKELGKEFHWVRTSNDIINFFEDRDNFILKEFDPLLKV